MEWRRKSLRQYVIKTDNPSTNGKQNLMTGNGKTITNRKNIPYPKGHSAMHALCAAKLRYGVTTAAAECSDLKTVRLHIESRRKADAA